MASLPLDNERLGLSTGMQIEFPTGDEEHGIADDHTAYLPCVSVSRHFSDLLLFGTLGYRGSSGESDHQAVDHDVETSFINPHSDSEIVYRVGLRSRLFDGSWNLEGLVDGQHVTDPDEDVKGSISAEIRSEFAMTDRIGWSIFGDFPLSSPERFDWRAGVGIHFRF